MSQAEFTRAYLAVIAKDRHAVLEALALCSSASFRSTF
jgi:hypothetical protein